MEIDRDTIVRAARGWIGTPYADNAHLKGVGCDCLGLLIGVWREILGEVPEIPHYSPDWGEITGEEVMLEAMRQHLVEIATAEAGPGDVAVFRMLRSYPAKHCGILAERDGVRTVIHGRMRHAVAEEDMTREFFRRMAFAFRLPGV